MRFLIFGCNGMAGHMISLYLKEAGHTVVGVAREKSRYVDTIVGDATDAQFVSDTVKSGKYDAVVNCIGILNQFAEENKDHAVLLNAYLPHFLAQLTAQSETRVIHISTDCVFSGKRGRYSEQDIRDGESFYDRSKALGELEDHKNLTLRQSIIGPDIKPNGIGLLNWFLQQNGSVNGFTKAIWTGQTTLQLAKTIEIAAKERVTGLHNMVPGTSISKYELLELFNKWLREEPIKINPVEGIALDKSLIRKNSGFDYDIPDYETMIRDLADWMKSHKDLYKHYYR